MSRFFIDRPIFAWVIAIIIMLAGVLAIYALPVEQYPDIAPPAVVRQRQLPGRLGRDGRGIGHPGHRAVHDRASTACVYMSSAAARRAAASVTLTFEAGTDPDIAQVQVQNKLQQALRRLPQPVQEQGVNVTKATGGFLA